MMSHTASQENASAGQQALIAAAATATLRSLVNAVGATKRRLLQQTPKLSPTCSVLALALWCVTLLLVLGELERAQAMELRRRVKRALYELPDGSEQILGSELRTSFTCDGLGYGYYADTDNDCKVFHVCQSFKMSDGSIYNNHWSFICGNQTVFNQLSLACSHLEDSIPCEAARDFYHVNDYFGDLRAPSVRDTDLSLASELISRAYGSRLSAAGAGQ